VRPSNPRPLEARPLAVLLLVAALALGAAPPASAQPGSLTPEALAATIDAVLADTAFADSFWGVHVVDLASGRTLYARNPGHNFVPASTMKLLTTAAALESLGPEYRYTTALYYDVAPTGDGHLVVRGSGDPTISDRRFTTHFPTDGDPHTVFRQWADSLRTREITRISGHVLGDDRAFSGRLLGAGWAWDDEPSPFAAQIAALSFNEGRLTVSATGTVAGRRATVRVEPETDYVFIANRTETRPPQGGARHDVRRDPGSNAIWIESEVPQGQTLTRTVSVHNPARYFVHVLRAVLREEGIAVDGDPVAGDDWPDPFDYGRMVRVATHTSPPLAEIAAVTNKTSQNLYAEHLLRTLGAERCEEARARASRARAGRLECGSPEAGLLAAEDLFERAGMRTSRMRLRDGSGMSPYNMLAPSDLTSLLAYMWAHPDPGVRDTFVASLAVGGRDGTLRGRFTDGPGRGAVLAKTGTVTGARNLAGYVTTAGGTPLAFALLTNQFGTTTGRVTRGQDAIVEALARYRR